MKFSEVSVKCGVVAGLAGASLRGGELREMFVSVAGVLKERVQVSSDIEILLEMIGDGVSGAVLISGTGSVCMGKNGRSEEHRGKVNIIVYLILIMIVIRIVSFCI